MAIETTANAAVRATATSRPGIRARRAAIPAATATNSGTHAGARWRGVR
jgi:hypothetical protein